MGGVISEHSAVKESALGDSILVNGRIPMNHVSAELLKIAGRLEEAGLDEPASRLAVLAEKVSRDDRLLTVEEAAQWLGCGRRTLDRLIAERRIPAYLIGGRYRIDKHQVLKETKLGR